MNSFTLVVMETEPVTLPTSMLCRWGKHLSWCCHSDVMSLSDRGLSCVELDSNWMVRNTGATDAWMKKENRKFTNTETDLNRFKWNKSQMANWKGNPTVDEARLRMVLSILSWMRPGWGWCWVFYHGWDQGGVGVEYFIMDETRVGLVLSIWPWMRPDWG